MVEILDGVYCNGILGDGRGIPQTIGDLIHYLYLGIKIVVPILLVIFAMLDLGRAITAKKEEDIKKQVEVPNIEGLTIKEATKLLKSLNLDLQIENEVQDLDKENTIVKEQVPKREIKVYEGTKVIIKI